jgi:hypothetical protein
MKKEIVPLVLAIIGLVADIVGIFTFFYSSNAQNNLGIQINASMVAYISQFILYYFWFVATWFFVRRTYLKDINKGQYQRNRAVIRTIIIGIGIAILPVHLLLCTVFGSSMFTGTLGFLFFGGILIYESLKSLFATIYPEMITYISRVGKYICIRDFQSSTFNQTTYQKNVIIEVKRKEIPEIIYYTVVGIVFDMMHDMFNPTYIVTDGLGKEYAIKEHELLTCFEIID